MDDEPYLEEDSTPDSFSDSRRCARLLPAAPIYGLRGHFHGSPERPPSMNIFTKYPEDAEKVVLSIKGGMVPAN